MRQRQNVLQVEMNTVNVTFWVTYVTNTLRIPCHNYYRESKRQRATRSSETQHSLNAATWHSCVAESCRTPCNRPTAQHSAVQYIAHSETPKYNTWSPIYWSRIEICCRRAAHISKKTHSSITSRERSVLCVILMESISYQVVKLRAQASLPPQ